MYKPIRKADLIIGGTAVKQGEIFTLGFQLFDANGLVIVPTVGQTISVKIANKTGVVFETTAVVVSDHIEFTVAENIGAGKMRVELTVADGVNVLQKYPANGYIELYITASLDDIGTGTIYTVTAAEMFTRIEGSETASAEAVQTAGEAVTIAGNAVVTADAVRADFDLVVAEAGSSNPEVVLARGEFATLEGRLDDANQQLAETFDRTPNYEPLLLESRTEVHSSGFTYTAFGSGIAIQGKEIHVMRSGAHHVTVPADGWAKIIAYIRGLDGAFTTQEIALDYSVREYRDPNITLNKDGTTLIMSAVGYDGVSYTNWMWTLDASLNVLTTTELPFGNYFGWGNLLYTPNGNPIKTAYNMAGFTATPSVGSVNLFTKIGAGAWQSVNIFPETTERTTETTIGYWGNKLVAIARQDMGSGMYRETSDLEGLTGWGTIKKFNLITEAPCLSAYTPPDEPLILTYSSAVGTTGRDVWIMATFDGITWTKNRRIAINTQRGGYNTFVKNAYGYSMIYFDDGVATDLWHKDVDINKYIPELTYYKTIYANARNVLIDKATKLTASLPYTHLDGITVSGHPHHYNKIMARNSTSSSLFLKMKATNVCNGIVLSVRSNNNPASSTVRVDLYKAGVLVATGIDIIIPNANNVSPKMQRFQFPASSLTLNDEYEFRIIGNCTLFYNDGYILPFDSYDYTVTQCKVNGTPVTGFISFGLTLHHA